MMRIALVVNDDFSAWHFRKGLILTLCEQGHTVHVVTPVGPGRPYARMIEGLGAHHHPIRLDRFISPLHDLRLLWTLYRFFRAQRIELVHNMTVKPMIYGAVAARLARVRRVVGLVSGTGLPFLEDASWRRRLLRRIVVLLYRIALARTDKIWFQNSDDLEMFCSMGLTTRAQAVLIRSGGVDLTEFSEASIEPRVVQDVRADLGLREGTVNVVMIVARLIWSKGVREFVEAAKRLRVDCPRAQFFLVGPHERRHPDAVPAEYLQQVAAPNLRVLAHFRQDVREILSLADIVVLPSYFREGVPRVLLEALAMGKPVVTTTGPGCREVVDHGYNGYLVPARDPEALASAVSSLAGDEALRREFGQRSRMKAETEFDEQAVIKSVLDSVYELSSSDGSFRR
jgi:glycosyltransferase involved in cell wall biosynthesis